MNKKYIMFGLMALFAVGIVSATIGYYAMFSTTLTIKDSISDDCGSSIIDTFGGETVEGTPCTITNNAPSERIINITEDSIDDINVRYMSELVLAEKNTTTWIPTTNTETIIYTVVGEDFVVEEIPAGMTLIYYPNFVGDVFATNVAGIQVLTNGADGNLPVALDVGDDYCGNGHNPNAVQCVGAKLWLLPGVLTLQQAKDLVLAWDTTSFVFETELIQYNEDGIIKLSNGSSIIITPVFEIGDYVTGSQVINTTIA